MRRTCDAHGCLPGCGLRCGLVGRLTAHSLDTSEARARQDDRNRYVCLVLPCARASHCVRTSGAICGRWSVSYRVPLPVATRWRHLYGEGGLFPVSSFEMARVGRSLARNLRRGSSTFGWVLSELAVGLGADARCWPWGAGRTAMQDGCRRGVVQCSVEKRSGEKKEMREKRVLSSAP